MNPAAIAAILQVFLAALKAAPQVAEVVKTFKELFAGLLKNGIITRDQQDACCAYVDAQAALVTAGITPPHWTVEPDPV